MSRSVCLCRLNQAHRQYVDSSGLNKSAATPLQTSMIVPEKEVDLHSFYARS